MTVQDFRSMYDSVRWLPFYNYETEEVPAHGIMAFVQDPTYDPDGHPVLGCEQPGSQFDRMYAVNGPTPVPEGGYGVCAVLGSGPVIALCDASAVTPADNQQWGPTSGSWVLSPYRYGFMCFGGADGSSSEAKALFMPIEITKVIGLIDDASGMSQNGSVSVDVYYGSNASPSDTTQNITAYDWLLDTGQTIADDVEVVVEWISGAWYVTAARCAT